MVIIALKFRHLLCILRKSSGEKNCFSSWISQYTLHACKKQDQVGLPPLKTRIDQLFLELELRFVYHGTIA